MKSRQWVAASIFAIIFALWAAWLMFVLHHSKFGEFSDKNSSITLEQLGAFGDAFGVLASLMAALAASAAFIAFQRQQFDAKSQEFERNFFSLLTNLQLQVEQTDVSRFRDRAFSSLRKEYENIKNGFLIVNDQKPFSTKVATIKGRDAYRVLLNRLRRIIRDEEKFKDAKLINKLYENRFYNIWHDDLGHYFRTVYHIYKMIDEECPENKKRYAQIVRSHLSSSQIILIGYNCAVGEGRHKFKKLVNKYEVLHNFHLDGNVDFYRAEKDFLERYVGLEAFGDQTKIPFTYC